MGDRTHLNNLCLSYKSGSKHKLWTLGFSSWNEEMIMIWWKAKYKNYRVWHKIRFTLKNYRRHGQIWSAQSSFSSQHGSLADVERCRHCIYYQRHLALTAYVMACFEWHTHVLKFTPRVLTHPVFIYKDRSM